MYNEAEIIEDCIKQINDFLRKNRFKMSDYEIIIADNASSDETPRISEKLCRRYKRVRYMRLGKKGRGRAIKKAFNSSKADILCYMDSDLATDLKALPKAIEAITNGFDIAIGSRLDKGAVVKRSLLREILSRGYNLIVRRALKVHFRDAQCGFKLINRKILKEIVPKIEDNEWFFDTELLFLAEKAGFRIKEIPVKWTEKGGLKRTGKTEEKNKQFQRKSKVKLLKTICNYLISINRLRTESRKNN